MNKFDDPKRKLIKEKTYETTLTIILTKLLNTYNFKTLS